MTQPQAVILVHSTSHALRAERQLGQAGIGCKLVPVPRYLSSDCGVCVRILLADRDHALETLAAAGLETAGFHEI